MRIGLFPTCLVDLFRPAIGFASARLLRDGGCAVDLPADVTCCGQPAYNAGDPDLARKIARQVVAACAGFDYVVVPSGACAGMIRKHYPALLADDPAWRDPAATLAARTYELVSFLTDVLHVETVSARHAACATYHDGCSGLRELGVKEQPRRLLASVEGLTLAEMPGAETCCGFGGLFSVKYPEISARMAADKMAEIEASGATMLLAGDLGCLMHLAGTLARAGSAVEVRHIAEVLAGMSETPGLGAEDTAP